MLGGLAAIGLGALLQAPWILFWAYNAAVAVLLMLDWICCPRKRTFSAHRSFERTFELRRRSSVTLTIRARARRALSMRVSDAPPEGFLWDHQAPKMTCEADGSVTHTYAVQPTLRGIFRFECCYVQVTGPLGLSTRRYALPCPGNAPVYPDLEPMRRYRLLAERRQLDRDDQSSHCVRGVGSEFVGIREYTPDDDNRKINWMATARVGKPMTSVFDVERNQQILLAVDMGRWMHAPMGEVTRLDRAVELAAAMAQVAISSGDRVGLVLFDTEVRAYLKPGKGTVHMNRVLELLYKARSSTCESRLSDLSAFAQTRMRNRGMVCVFSYLDGEDAARAAGRDLFFLGRRHALQFASLTDPLLGMLSDRPADSSHRLYVKAAAIYRTATEQNAARVLQASGMFCQADEPVRLLSRVVSRYVSMKQQL